MSLVCIVDDDKVFLAKLEQELRLFEMFQNSEIYSYSDSLHSDILKNKFSVYIFDIDMPEVNGFGLAKEIRRKYNDAIIIFISQYEDFVYESFNFQAYYFIRKKLLEKDLSKAIYKIQNQMLRKREAYIFKREGEEFAIEYQDIVYFEKDKNRVHIYLRNGKVLSERKSIKQIMLGMQSNGFCLVNSGIIVNFQYIQEIDSAKVILRDGSIMNISRGKNKEVKDNYAKYILAEAS